MVRLRPRGQPAQGRHHAPLLRPAQPRPRPVRRGVGPWLADADGKPRAYRSSDNVVEPSLAERRPQSVIDAVRDAGLQFDGGRGTGVVLHMLGCLAVDGRFGVTAIGRTPEEADELYAATLAAVVPRGADAIDLTP